MRGIFVSLLLLVALVGVAALAVWPGLSAWFVADDFWHLGYVRFVESPWTSWFHPQFGDLAFRPVTYTINFYLDWALALSPFSIHAVNLALHVLNSLLVFGLSLAVLSRREREDGVGITQGPLMPAAAAAMVFAVHPVTALTSVWYACRADLYGTFFSLLVLILAALVKRVTWPALVSVFVASFLAMLAKGTYMPLFLTVPILALLGAPKESRRWKRAGAFFTASSLAFLAYLGWRMLVLSEFGGYEHLPGSAAVFMEEAAYHLPLTARLIGRDLLAHHMGQDHVLFPVYAALGTAFVLFGVFGGVRRRAWVLAAAVVFTAAMSAPVWNLSHMLVFREERLLYFPLAGLALAVAALADGPRSAALRTAAAVSLAAVCAVLLFYSREQVANWRDNAEQNRLLASELAGEIEKLAEADSSRAQRVYVLGLSTEHYYLDMMVKMKLGKSLLARKVMQGERPSFIWLPGQVAEFNWDHDLPVEARPKIERHSTDPSMSLMTATPPDLLAAARFDRAAVVLEYQNGKFNDITASLRSLYNLRENWQARAGREPSVLPSFSFKKARFPLGWEPSSGVAVEEPDKIGAVYTFIALDQDPYLWSPHLNLNPLLAAEAVIELLIEKQPYLPPAASQGCLAWIKKDGHGAGPDGSICFPVKADGRLHEYVVDLEEDVAWVMAGEITRLRIDPLNYPATFQFHGLEFKAESDVQSADGGK